MRIHCGDRGLADEVLRRIGVAELDEAAHWGQLLTAPHLGHQRLFTLKAISPTANPINVAGAPTIRNPTYASFLIGISGRRLRNTSGGCSQIVTVRRTGRKGIDGEEMWQNCCIDHHHGERLVASVPMARYGGGRWRVDAKH
jgi:hypothetical protein